MTTNSKQRFSALKTPHQARIEQMMLLIRGCSGDDSFDLPSVPVVPADKIRLGRAKLIMEEALEALDALGITISVKFTRECCVEDITKGLCLKNLEFNVMPATNVDLPHVAKELADLSVVTIGTMSACGITDAEILVEVDANNLNKFSSGGYMEGTKWRKPPNHPDPDIAACLVRQGWNRSENGREEVQRNEDLSVPSGRDGS